MKGLFLATQRVPLRGKVTAFSLRLFTKGFDPRSSLFLIISSTWDVCTFQPFGQTLTAQVKLNLDYSSYLKL